MPIELTIHEGSGPGRKQVLSKDVVFVGRREDNDVVLPYTFVSSRHGRLIRRDATLLVEDMGSTNGTLVNGEPLTPMVARPLRPEDRVEIGEIAILARWTEGGGAGEAEALTYHELPRQAVAPAPPPRPAAPPIPIEASYASPPAEAPEPPATLARLSPPPGLGPRLDAPSTAHLGQTSLSDALATSRAPRPETAGPDPYHRWELVFKTVGLAAIAAGLLLLILVLVA